MQDSQQNNKEEKFSVEASIEKMKLQLTSKFGTNMKDQFDNLSNVDQLTFYLGFVAGSACGWVEGVSELSKNLVEAGAVGVKTK